MKLVRATGNELGLAARTRRSRWWPAAVLALLAPPAVWFVWTAALTSAEEEKPASEAKPAGKEKQGAPEGRKTYTATAMWLVHVETPTIAGANPAAARQWSRDRFEIYKATQQQLLLSRFVLSAALRDPRVAKLPSVRHAQVAGDPVRWLKGRLRVTFPGHAEIMEVSLTATDPNEAAVLLQGVVDGYMREVVNVEMDRRRMRLSELDRAVCEKEQEVRSRREELKKLATELGTSSTEALTLKQKLALEELSSLRQELRKLKADLRIAQTGLAVQKALLPDAGKDEKAKLVVLIRRLEAEVAVETEQEKDLEKQVQRRQREAELFGNSTVDMEMLLADIKNADVVLNMLAAERDKVRIECRAAPRVSLLEPPQRPVAPDN